MAKLETIVTEKPIQIVQTVMQKQEEILLTLTPREANILRMILGAGMYLNGEFEKEMQSLYRVLCKSFPHHLPELEVMGQCKLRTK